MELPRKISNGLLCLCGCYHLAERDLLGRLILQLDLERAIFVGGSMCRRWHTHGMVPRGIIGRLEKLWWWETALGCKDSDLSVGLQCSIARYWVEKRRKCFLLTLIIYTVIVSQCKTIQHAVFFKKCYLVPTDGIHWCRRTQSSSTKQSTLGSSCFGESCVRHQAHRRR